VSVKIGGTNQGNCDACLDALDELRAVGSQLRFRLPKLVCSDIVFTAAAIAVLDASLACQMEGAPLAARRSDVMYMLSNARSWRAEHRKHEEQRGT
jgi:hypothetical protein